MAKLGETGTGTGLKLGRNMTGPGDRDKEQAEETMHNRTQSFQVDVCLVLDLLSCFPLQMHCCFHNSTNRTDRHRQQ